MKRHLGSIDSIFCKRERLEVNTALDDNSDAVSSETCGKLQLACMEKSGIRCEKSAPTAVNLSISTVEICHSKNVMVNSQTAASSPSDPSRPIPRTEDELQRLVLRGPHQPIGPFSRKKIGEKQRGFRAEFYKDFPWVEYSFETECMYCFTCRIFGQKVSHCHGKIDPSFTTAGCKNWTNPTRALRKHSTSLHHQRALQLHEDFKRSPEFLASLLEATKTKHIEEESQCTENNDVMLRLFRIVQILGHQGILFGGNSESSDSDFHGMYLELCELLAEFDTVLAKHKTASSHTYTSKTIQNELINIMFEVMCYKIKKELQDVQWVSVVVEETTDYSHNEHIVVLLRFCDASLNVHENLISIQPADELDSWSLMTILKTSLAAVGVTENEIIALCYDSVTAKKGVNKGVHALVTEWCGRAVPYVHYYTHCLNLLLVGAMKCTRPAFSFFGHLENLYTFIESNCAHHSVLENIMKAVRLLKPLSDARWPCRAEAVNAIARNIQALGIALKEIEDRTFCSKTAVQAAGLYEAMLSFNFLFWLTMLAPLLNAINKASKELQRAREDLLCVCHAVSMLKTVLHDMKDGYDSLFSSLAQQCDTTGISVVHNGTVTFGSGRNPDNENFYLNIKESMRQDYNEVLNNTLSELDERFSPEVVSLLEGFAHVLLKRRASDQKILLVAGFCHVSQCDLATEIMLIRNDNLFNEESYCSIDELLLCLKNPASAMYTVFRKVMGVFLTLPITSTSVGQSNSKLALVRTKIHSAVYHDRLDALLMMSVEQNLCKSINLNQCVEVFKMKHCHSMHV
ncbi:zinc finger MYM-type protein 1-like [Lissotriton helveticus]